MTSLFWTQWQSLLFLALVVVGITIGLTIKPRFSFDRRAEFSEDKLWFDKLWFDKLWFDKLTRRDIDKLTRRDNDKEVVKEYFNGVGFERWRRIYGTEPVNSVQADIRLGHQQTIDRVLTWLKEEGSLENISICDVGCGTGSLSLPLAQLGAKVWANDISARMVEVAKSQAVNPDNPQFQVADLEQITGTYDTVICLDVLIHYPLADAQRMIKHLASLSTHRLILSFAPKTLYYAILKKIGSLFPGASKATRAYLHPESAIRQTLAAAGFTVTKDAMQKTKFYFSRLLLAERKT